MKSLKLIGELQVYEGKDKIYESLGITRERADELIGMASRIWGKQSYITDVIFELAKETKNLNELLYATLLVGCALALEESQQQL